MREVQLFQVHTFKVLNLSDLVLSEGERHQALVAGESFDLSDLVVVQTEMLHVWVEHDVLDLCDLIARVIDYFKIGRRGKVEHLHNSVVAGVELDQVLDVGQMG